MQESVCFLNGKVVPLKEATVHVYDLGLLRGFGVYEGIAAFAGEPFRFHDHFVRLGKSAKELSLSIPVSEEESLAVTRKIISHNGLENRATIRVILLGGIGEGGIRQVPGRETFFISAEPAVLPPKEWYEEGARIITYPHTRFMPEYKTIHYITAVLLQPKLKEAQAVEAIYINNGRILEGTGSNIFIVKNGKLITPDKGILHGITRKVVLDLARGDFPTELREVSLDELMNADEVFITSSFKDIVPISKIDGKEVGGGKAGLITKDLIERFRTEIAAGQ